MFRVGSRTIIGCFGLDSDSKILMDKLREVLSDHYENSVYTDLEPENVAHLISDILYGQNLLLSPIVIGLDSDHKPYICAMDELGENYSVHTHIFVLHLNVSSCNTAQEHSLPLISSLCKVQLVQHYMVYANLSTCLT